MITTHLEAFTFFTGFVEAAAPANPDEFAGVTTAGPYAFFEKFVEAEAEVVDDVNVPGPIRRKKRYILPDGRVVHSYQAAIDALQARVAEAPEVPEATPAPAGQIVETKDSALLLAPVDAIPADAQAMRIQAQRERQAIIELKALRDEDDAIALLLLIN